MLYGRIDFGKMTERQLFRQAAAEKSSTLTKLAGATSNCALAKSPLA
jgi:hypothetical protein